MKKSKLLINPKSSSAQTSIVFMFLAAVFILLGTVAGTLTRAWVVLSPFALTNELMVAYFVLPLLAAVLFAICVFFLGKRAFFLSAIPVFLAAVSTMVKAFQMGSAVGYVELILCVGLVALYVCTVLGLVPRGFFIGLTVVILGLHTYFGVYTDIHTSIYRFSQLLCEIGILFLYIGFIFAISGGTKQRIIDPATATTVAPPIPGSVNLGGIKNAAVSAPRPETPVKMEEPVIPVVEAKPEVPITEQPIAHKYFTDPTFSVPETGAPEEAVDVAESSQPIVETVAEEIIPATEVVAEETPIEEGEKSVRNKRNRTKKKTEDVE